MLIIGAKGFAKEVLQIVHQNNELKDLAFYDDVNLDIGEELYSLFPILNSLEKAKHYFETISNKFTIGIGNPILRKKLYDKFTEIGGEFTSTISTSSIIGSYNNTIESGCNIMQNVVITNDVSIKKGTIINQIASIGHDVIIGQFCEICPNVSISGNCSIDDFTFIGTGAIILPGLKIGKNVIIGAGAVVTKNIEDNSVAVGAPAKVIKINEAII